MATPATTLKSWVEQSSPPVGRTDEQPTAAYSPAHAASCSNETSRRAESFDPQESAETLQPPSLSLLFPGHTLCKTQRQTAVSLGHGRGILASIASKTLL